MRSLYSGVSGLKTHQTKMDVIGNNIANVNTTAYKSSSISFSELMYQTTQKASGPNASTGTGGTNARQIGLGVQSAKKQLALQKNLLPKRMLSLRKKTKLVLKGQRQLRQKELPELLKKRQKAILVFWVPT